MQHRNSERLNAKVEVRARNYSAGIAWGSRVLFVSRELWFFWTASTFPLNKGGKEGEAFWGLSWRIQETRTDNPQALRDHCRFAPPPLLRGNSFALRRS